MTKRMRAIEVLPDRMQLEASNAPQEVIEIDLSTATSKSRLLEAIGTAMAFPDYFGLNWDALEECLRDLNEGKQGWLLIFEEADSLLSVPKRELATFLSILADTATFWAGQGRRFRVVFIGSAALASQIHAEGPDRQGL